MAALPEAVSASVITYEQAMESVRALTPKLKARATEAERTRRVPDETLRELNASGLMRVLQPWR